MSDTVHSVLEGQNAFHIAMRALTELRESARKTARHQPDITDAPYQAAIADFLVTTGEQQGPDGLASALKNLYQQMGTQNAGKSFLTRPQITLFDQALDDSLNRVKPQGHRQNSMQKNAAHSLRKRILGRVRNTLAATGLASGVVSYGASMYAAPSREELQSSAMMANAGASVPKDNEVSDTPKKVIFNSGLACLALLTLAGLVESRQQRTWTNAEREIYDQATVATKAVAKFVADPEMLVTLRGVAEPSASPSR